MIKVHRKGRKANRFARFLFLIIAIIYLITLVLFTKSIINLSGIETVLRYGAIAIFTFYFFFYSYISIKKIPKKKYGLFYFLTIISILFIAIFIVCFLAIDMVLGKISNFNDKDKIEYTSYLISLNDKILDKDSIIGMVDDENDIEGNILAKEIISDNNLTQKIKLYKDAESDPYLQMLYDLYEDKVDAIFVSSNYVTYYSSEQDFGNIAAETTVLYKKSGLFKNKDIYNSGAKSLRDPFTVLVMGVDSEYDGLNANAAFNGDTLILATFNPKTLSATLLSLPRDIYVPIACRNNNYAKINSSAGSGTSCVIKTIENLTDLKIDYYVKINFKGVVDLVNAVGGITVNVENPDYEYNHGNYCGGKVCEQNSDRLWGSYTIYITPGMQKLNGEEALAYARCRGLYAESDIARNRHQQEIIMALAKEAMHIKSFGDFKKILDAVSKNIATNMNNSQILSSYNIFKDMVGKALNDEDFIEIQKTKLEVYNLPVYLPSGNTTSALGYYESSLNDIIKTMKINLELEEAEIIKSFEYSLNENYEVKVAGAGLRSGSSNSVLASFIGKTKDDAKKYCEDNNIECSFTYVDDNSKFYDDELDIDLISFQSPHANTLMKNVDEVTFYINGEKTDKKDKTENEKSTSEETDNEQKNSED